MTSDHDLRRLAHRMVWVPGRVAHGCWSACSRRC